MIDWSSSSFLSLGFDGIEVPQSQPRLLFVIIQNHNIVEHPSSIFIGISNNHPNINGPQRAMPPD